MDVWDCFGQSGAEIMRLFSDNLGLNLGLFLDSLELKFRDCFGQSRN